MTKMIPEDEALAMVAAAYEAAAGVVDDPGDNIANRAMGQRLCCDGRECGCHGADVGQYLQHFIRALTPADATAALSQLLDAAERKGMERAEIAPFHFDRYINGVLMAEGVTIEKQSDLQSAMRVAAKIASRGPNGEPPVLVYRPAEIRASADPGFQAAMAERAEWKRRYLPEEG